MGGGNCCLCARQHVRSTIAAAGELLSRRVPSLCRYHNDCVHIAQALLTLPHAYAPRLQQLLGCTAVNFVAASRRCARAGEDCLDAMVRPVLQV